MCTYDRERALFTAVFFLSGVVNVLPFWERCEDRLESTADGKFSLCSYINPLHCCVLKRFSSPLIILQLHNHSNSIQAYRQCSLPHCEQYLTPFVVGHWVNIQATCYPDGSVRCNWTSDQRTEHLQIEYQCYNATADQETVRSVCCYKIIVETMWDS